MRIILIGYMGSGKSTMGKKIARLLNLRFIDSDKEISEQFGKSIPELFATEGEEKFRALEQSFIRSLPKEEDFVLSTGGGLPCYNHLIEELNALGTTVYLSHPVKELVNRLLKSKTKRPIIEGKSEEELIAFVTKHLNERIPCYSKAHFTVPRSISKPAQLLDFIGINQKN